LNSQQKPGAITVCTIHYPQSGGARRRLCAQFFTAVLLASSLGRGLLAGEIILFTASTDFTLNNPSGGYSFPNDPVNQNPNLPQISAGVTLAPATGGLSNTTVGPLPDGTTYGPLGFNQNAGGTTSWVTTSYTFASAGHFRLIWEVAELVGAQGGDALATDNVSLDGNKLVQFQPGGMLPGGYTGLGNAGTSAGVPGLPTSGGDPGFAWIDVQPNMSTGIPPLFDTSGNVASASRLFSATFDARAGDVLSLDVAFLTNDGSPFSDYGAVAMQSVPEPSALILGGLGFASAVGLATRRGRRRSNLR
jgi:hypothetical protein